MAHPVMTPRATYRLQFHADFTFADAEAIVPYLAGLGISHVYASPVTLAAAGSRHGYDVIDPTRISAEAGGETGLRALVASLRAHDMGLIIDIVPNHMGVAGDENGLWMDVLEHGEASEFAAVFDIDRGGPIILPVLGSPLPEAIAAGDVRLVEKGGALGLKVHDGPVYPIRPDDPVMAGDRGAVLARHDPAAAEGRALLRELAERQHYRLTYWRAANDLLNWRRFFAVNELAGVRVEDPQVFALTHRLFFDLFAQGLIDGVRVDHVDGLTDPAAYCHALRAGFEAVAPDRRAYIVVEKILAAGEPLAIDWTTDGTSGYDFMRDVGGLLHDAAGLPSLRALWERVSGRTPDFAAEAVAARGDILSWQFEGQLEACVRHFLAIAHDAGQDWLTPGMLRRGIAALLRIFPVYRTYGTGTAAPPDDAAVRTAARIAAASHIPPGEEPVIDFLLDRLAGKGGGAPALAAEAVRRFQQLSAPIAAKGVEDTAFYRHAAVLSANDVGFDPAHAALSVEEFHAATLARARAHPHAMLATATHDHKRGEDARARLALLSAIPDIWEAHVRRWMDLAAPHAGDLHPADIYQLFQTLVGAWEGWSDPLLTRVQGWQDKMLREAKLRSSWEAPDEHYEAHYRRLAEILLTGPEGAAFRSDFAAFIERLAPAATANSLMQTFLHYTVPGLPDLYQGCELMDHSMVDPDNRRPVDYALCRAVADGSEGGQPHAKFDLIRDLLSLRTAHPRLFADGDYRPLVATGTRAEHVVAFTRSCDGQTLLAIAAVRLGATLAGSMVPVDAAWWGDTCVGDGASRWRVGDLLGSAPVHARLIDGPA